MALGVGSHRDPPQDGPVGAVDTREGIRSEDHHLGDSCQSCDERACVCGLVVERLPEADDDTLHARIHLRLLGRVDVDVQAVGAMEHQLVARHRLYEGG